MQQKSLTKNSIFYMIYNILNVVFPFISGMYVAHILLPSSIGEVAHASNIAQYFVILAFLGIPTYGLREISKARHDREKLNKVYSELLVINFCSTIVFLAAYWILVFSVEAFRSNLPLYLISSFSIALNVLNNAWLYEGLEEFRFVSLRNAVFKAIMLVLLILLVRKPEHYLRYAALSVIGIAGNYVVNIVHARKHVHFQLHGLEFRRHMGPILTLVLVNIAIELYSLVDITMLGFLSTKANVAYYKYGSYINKVLLSIVSTFTTVLVPRLATTYRDDKDTFNELLTKGVRVILLFALPMIVGIQFVSDFLICKIYGQQYITASYVLKILSPVLLISPIGYLLGSRVLLVAGKEKKMTISVAAGAIVNVIGNYFLIQAYQEMGAAVASVISEIVVMIIYLTLGSGFYSLHGLKGSVFRILLASAVMGAYLLAVSFLPLGGWPKTVFQIIGAVIVYACVLLVTKEEMALQYTKRLFAVLNRNK